MASRRSKRDTPGSVQLKIGDMVRAISVDCAGVPYAVYCNGKNPATLDYVSVLEFVSIESYLKGISSDYGSNKEY